MATGGAEQVRKQGGDTVAYRHLIHRGFLILNGAVPPRHKCKDFILEGLLIARRSGYVEFNLRHSRDGK